jgi:hypothetical protein
MKKALAVALMFCAGAAAAQNHVTRCFQPNDIEAEQAILFQTELMVVAEACRDKAYIDFLRRNKDQIIAYQKHMIEFFRRHGESKADIAFDSWHTRLANQSALRNSQVPVSVLCAEGKTLLDTANMLKPKDFKSYVAEKANLHRQYYVACR